MTDKSLSTGVQTTGENINWRYLNEERTDDPIITILMKEAKAIFIDKKSENTIIDNNVIFKTYLETFIKYIKDNKNYKIKYIELNDKDINDGAKVDIKDDKKSKKHNKHGVKQEMNKKDMMLKNIAEENLKKDMKSFIDSLIITEEHTPINNRKHIESFFTILNWSIYILNSKLSIDTRLYLNCAISLYRAITECDFITEHVKSIVIEIIIKLEDVINKRCLNKEYIYKLLIDNILTITDSYWDINKPKSIALYNEQKDIISLVINNLNNKLLIFYEMPPANGKTVLSAILAKIIRNQNKENKKNIPKYRNKTLLYICYNTIVRNEVAKLCITHSLDVKYWLAVTGPDKDTGKMKPFLRPYKNCYPDWNKKRTTKEQEKYDALKINRYNDDIFEQWKFYMNETRPLSEQITESKDYFNGDNLPEMIISDLDSAYVLLSRFPDTFITYFDESFASSNLEITSKIMSVLGHTVLVSATLAKPEEIPTVINDFKMRHNHINNDFLHIIKSTKQHISCTFIDENGYIFAPHNNITNLDELELFIMNLEKPLIRRGYAPEVVFNISKFINDDLPTEYKFREYFHKIGMINHETLRDYMCDILRYVVNTRNDVLFDKIQSVRILKIPDMNITSMFTNSAYHYNGAKTLHVATSEGFNNHIEELARPFLEGSPKINDTITVYNRELAEIDGKLKSLERNGNKDSDFERSKLYKMKDNLKLKWPAEYIVNSFSHATKYETSSNINTYNTEIFAKKSDLDIFNDTRTKLLFSGIGIYEPENFSNAEMDYFLRKKDAFKFILSTPFIVYGTNISLSIIDIDRSFIRDSTKNTLYQLIGRAGRKGRSNSATIIFRDNEMLNMILTNDTYNIDAQYVEENYNKLLMNRDIN